VPSSRALWGGLQSVHGFRCYDNIYVCKLIALYAANAYSAEREMSASACTRSMPVSITCGFVVQQAVQQNSQLIEQVEFGHISSDLRLGRV